MPLVDVHSGGGGTHQDAGEDSGQWQPDDLDAEIGSGGRAHRGGSFPGADVWRSALDAELESELDSEGRGALQTERLRCVRSGIGGQLSFLTLRGGGSCE